MVIFCKMQFPNNQQSTKQENLVIQDRHFRLVS